MRFAAFHDAAPRYTCKASDMAFEMLVEQGIARPAPYLGRAECVQLVASDALSDEDLPAYVAQAHAPVAAELAKKARSGLGIA